MASISPPLLRIHEGVPAPGRALVQVSYRLSPTLHDIQHEQAYREVVQLIGDDTGPGEDGVNDIIPGGVIWDGTVVFGSTQPFLDQSHEKDIPVAILDEDRHPLLVRADEIRARVTLTPLPPPAPTRDSNLVVRQAGGNQT